MPTCIQLGTVIHPLEKTLPRLSRCRRIFRSGHRLTVSPTGETSFRRSRPSASQAVGLLWAHRSFHSLCAQERTRTSNPLRELAPQASAYTNSATWACASTFFTTHTLYQFFASRARYRKRPVRPLCSLQSRSPLPLLLLWEFPPFSSASCFP